MENLLRLSYELNNPLIVKLIGDEYFTQLSNQEKINKIGLIHTLFSNHELDNKLLFAYQKTKVSLGSESLIKNLLELAIHGYNGNGLFKLEEVKSRLSDLLTKNFIYDSVKDEFREL